MGRLKSMALALVIAGSVTTAAFAQSSMQDPMVGGAAMYPSKNIVQNAMNSPDHTTLVALVKKAGLVATLEGPGPFTVFAPTNAAFAKLPQATVEQGHRRQSPLSEGAHLSRGSGSHRFEAAGADDLGRRR